jgi:hypothetical protein
MIEPINSIIIGIFTSIIAAIFVAATRLIFEKMFRNSLVNHRVTKKLKDSYKFIKRSQRFFEYAKKIAEYNKQLVDMKIELVYKLLSLMIVLLLWFIDIICSFIIIIMISKNPELNDKWINFEWILLLPLICLSILGGIRYSIFMEMRFCIKFLIENDLSNLEKIEQYIANSNNELKKNE